VSINFNLAKKLLENKTLIGVVGPCSAGKTTLIRGLNAQGYSARHIAQEHSFVPDMWRRITNPDILIYLNVSYEISMQRRDLNMSNKEFEIQLERLSHSRKHADLYLNTDKLSPEEVLAQVRDFLETRGV
jgi:deoxyadenosine/deoxycytidine kinase